MEKMETRLNETKLDAEILLSNKELAEEFFLDEWIDSEIDRVIDGGKNESERHINLKKSIIYPR